MAFARWGADSDVYVWPCETGIECSLCLLYHRCPFMAKDCREMLTHLEEHVAAGHKVPEYALEELREEGSGFIGDMSRYETRTTSKAGG